MFKSETVNGGLSNPVGGTLIKRVLNISASLTLLLTKLICSVKTLVQKKILQIT